MYIQPIKPSVKLHIKDLIDEMEDSMIQSALKVSPEWTDFKPDNLSKERTNNTMTKNEFSIYGSSSDIKEFRNLNKDSNEDTNNSFVICGIENYGYNRGGSGDAPDHGLIVWVKPSNRVYNKKSIKEGFTTYKLDSLSIYDILNQTGLNAIKPLAGKEIDSIMLSDVKPKTSMIRPVHRKYNNVYSDHSLSNLLVDWFVDYCNLLFKTIYKNENITQETCGYCHFKYDKEVALTAEKQFHHGDERIDTSDIYLDYDNVLKFEEEDGDIDKGYAVEQELKSNYCPHCGRPLLITTNESCDISGKINWEYSTNNIRHEF